MKIKQVILFIVLMLELLLSCSNPLKHTIKEMIGKEIFLTNAIYTKEGQDTVDFDIDKYEYKVLTYVGSSGCTSCMMKLAEWEKYIARNDSLFPGKVGYIFCYSSKSLQTVRYLLSQNQFNYPVYIDTAESFAHINSIPDNYMLQTFLLNGDNKIIAVGNPIINKNIEKLYDRILSNSSSE